VCPGCDELVKFVARWKVHEAVCNVYGRDGDPTVWDRVEHWHLPCYEAAGQPHGEAVRQELRVGNFKHALNR
jgi:hypothetical protein